MHDALVAVGCESLMAPMAADVPPAGMSLDIAYVADPWGTKLEMIEWTGLWRSLPGAARAEGVNHVAFGVTDMARTRAFYEPSRTHARERIRKCTTPDHARQTGGADRGLTRRARSHPGAPLASKRERRAPRGAT